MYEIVIIIPYRNRKDHLKTFIDSTYRIFKENLKNFKLIIIEQEEGKLFNRGKILNVGFSLFKDKTNFFITHDVDICPKKSVVMDLYINKDYDALRISVPHEKSFGQICKLSHDSVFSCNGFPNYIWGWGIEDRALFYRYKILNKNISKNFSDKNNFSFLYHSSNVENYQGDKKKNFKLRRLYI